MDAPEEQSLSVGFDGIAGLLAPITIVCGHYGVGKTSLSVSLAIDAARAGWDVVLSDMDVVNPYFRSSDYKAVVEGAGVRLIEPVYARSNVDGPSITNETAGAIEWASRDAGEAGKPRLLIIDAGGDDSGATVLGRFSAAIEAAGYGMLYVVNRQRGFCARSRRRATCPPRRSWATRISSPTRRLTRSRRASPSRSRAPTRSGCRFCSRPCRRGSIRASPTGKPPAFDRCSTACRCTVWDYTYWLHGNRQLRPLPQRRGA